MTPPPPLNVRVRGMRESVIDPILDELEEERGGRRCATCKGSFDFYISLDAGVSLET